MAYHGPPLSSGALRAITRDGAPDLLPVLQVIDVKKVGAAHAGPGVVHRFRLVLSDGDNYQQTMLAIQLNQLVHSGAIKKHSVIRVEECVAAAGARERAVCAVQASL